MMTISSARALLLSLALSAAPAFAVPLMDMRADELLAIAPEFSKSLALTPNQQTLWRQVEGRSRTVLRERQLRRDRLQQQAKTQLDGASVELRDLGAALDTEAATTSAEDKQLRELWLTVNDALDDKQRRQVAAFVADQMMRVPDSAAPHRAPQDEGDSGRGHGGGGHGKRGGGMGAGTSR